MDLDFGVMSKNSLPTLKFRIFPMFSSKTFIVSCFILRSTTYFELILNIKYEI